MTRTVFYKLRPLDTVAGAKNFTKGPTRSRVNADDSDDQQQPKSREGMLRRATISKRSLKDITQGTFSFKGDLFEGMQELCDKSVEADQLRMRVSSIVSKSETFQAAARAPVRLVRYMLLLGLLSIYLMIGVGFYTAEETKDCEPEPCAEHWSVVDALYFSIVTMSTVGYGDMSPTTDGSRARARPTAPLSHPPTHPPTSRRTHRAPSRRLEPTTARLFDQASSRSSTCCLASSSSSLGRARLWTT